MEINIPSEQRTEAAVPFMPLQPQLANAYVPFQQWTGQLYDLDTGLTRGTIFPELDIPQVGGEGLL